MKKIALLDVNGMISYQNDTVSLLKEFVSRDLSDDFLGLIISISSGGGNLYVAQDIVYHLNKASIPVIFVINEICASAAFYISLSGHKTFARPASLVGGICSSIEVVNYTELHKKIGIKKISYSNGINKKMLTPCDDYTSDGNSEAIQNLIDDLDQQFVDYIKETRPHLMGNDKYLDGRLFSGQTALSIGCVDQFGGIHEAYLELKSLFAVDEVEVVEIQIENSDEPALSESFLVQLKSFLQI